MTKFNIYDFIEHTKQNPSRWIHYCEVIMDPHGNIILNEPSHEETLIKYAMEKENKTREELKNEVPLTCLPIEWFVDKYGLIAIWYCGYMYGTYKRKGPNRFQKRSLDILLKHGLITEEHVQPACEYGRYQWRKSMGYES